MLPEVKSGVWHLRALFTEASDRDYRASLLDLSGGCTRVPLPSAFESLGSIRAYLASGRFDPGVVGFQRLRLYVNEDGTQVTSVRTTHYR